MRPAFSIIFLTTLIGAGQGLFLALFSGQLYSALRVLPAQDPLQFYALGSVLSLALLAAGLVSSFFHLGRPERAWRAASQWRTSWMSREVIVLPAFMAAVAAWGLVHFSGWDPLLFTFGSRFEVSLSLVLGLAGSILCFALFLCTGMIYACMKMLQEWASPLTVVNYTLFGAASGFMLATFFAAWQGSAQTGFFAGWALVLTVLALFSRAASLVRNARIKHKSTMQSAIGIRHARIEQKAQGSMGGSFNTREYFHGASARRYKNVKWAFLLLVFPLPLALVCAGLLTDMNGFYLAAFLVQYVGLIMERWFFFAQANHPQNLYYQTV